MVSQEEREILDYLKATPESFISAREICRRAGGKQRWEENERWALPILSRLLARGLIEADSSGHYRYPRSKHDSF